MALYPQERKLNPARCQKSVHSSYAFRSHQCERKAGPSGYCKQHDPARLKAAQDAKDAENDAWRQRNDKVEAQGNALLQAVGLQGRVYYSYDRHNPGFMQSVVISFDQLQDLIDRLKG